MANINYVDYGVLDSASAAYSTQAQALFDIMTKLDSTNTDLAGGFKNETSDAFLNRYESEYKKNMQELGDALESIAKFLTDYASQHREADEASASRIRG